MSGSFLYTYITDVAIYFCVEVNMCGGHKNSLYHVWYKLKKLYFLTITTNCSRSINTKVFCY